MKLIYLASPYTHKDPKIEQRRFEEITLIAAKLIAATGYAFFLPITQSHLLKPHHPALKGDFSTWAKIDLFAISRCDEVWVVKMTGWDKSVGVTAEIEFAKEKKIHVEYLKPENYL